MVARKKKIKWTFLGVCLTEGYRKLLSPNPIIQQLRVFIDHRFFSSVAAEGVQEGDLKRKQNNIRESRYKRSPSSPCSFFIDFYLLHNYILILLLGTKKRDNKRHHIQLYMQTIIIPKCLRRLIAQSYFLGSVPYPAEVFNIFALNVLLFLEQSRAEWGGNFVRVPSRLGLTASHTNPPSTLQPHLSLTTLCPTPIPWPTQPQHKAATALKA